MSNELITTDPNEPIGQEVSPGLTSESSFALAERAARLLCSSTIVPAMYQGAENMGNCVIALHMAARLKADPIQVMQNLYVIRGKPSWSSQFLIATFNSCGQFSKLRYRMTGTKGLDDYGCIAYATELATGETLEGTEVTIAIAKAEGWFSKNDSKWRTMPEQMLKYRAAAWFIRAIAPEISLGMHTADETEDFTSLDVPVHVNGNASTSEPSKPVLSPMEMLKQQQHASAATVVSQGETPTATPTATTLTHELGYCTADQKSKLEMLFIQAGIEVGDQRGILERRGVGAIRSLTEQQASELIAILQAKIEQAIEQPQLEPEPEPVAVPHAALDINGPCTPEHVAAVKEAMQDLEKELPGSTEAFIVNLADRDLVVSDLTVLQCEQLIEAIKFKQMQAFFDNLPFLCNAGPLSQNAQ